MMSTIFKSIVVAAAITVAAAAGSQIKPGDQSRWSLDFRARLEQPSAAPIQIHMTGDWISTISSMHQGKYEVQLQLADVHCLGDATQTAPSAALADFEARLTRPFWATYRRDGGLIEMHFYRDTTPPDRNLLQMIASELQLVRPPDSRTSWTAEERDGAGEYSALYLVPQPGHIVKRKLKYTYTDGLSGAPVGTVDIAIDRSEISISLAPDQSVAEIDGANRIRIDLSTNKAEPLAAVTEFHLGNLRTSQAPELIGGLDRALPQVLSSAIVTQHPDAAQVRAETDDRLLKDYDTDALLAAAFKKDASGEASPDRLTALFRRRPEAASAAATLLLNKGRQRAVTNAMGAAGSSSAVNALSGFAHNSSLPEDVRVDALVAFVQMQHPTVEAMRAPRDLIHDRNSAVQSAARMVSGALARAGRPDHGSEADMIDASLIALYRVARDTHENCELLGAMGNSVGPTVLPVIEDALGDTRVAVRAAAARALRLASGVDIDRLLAHIITSDPDATVRSDAIFAARFRRPLPAPLSDALRDAASNDGVDYVRRDAVAVLR